MGRFNSFNSQMSGFDSETKDAGFDEEEKDQDAADNDDDPFGFKASAQNSPGDFE